MEPEVSVWLSVIASELSVRFFRTLVGTTLLWPYALAVEELWVSLSCLAVAGSSSDPCAIGSCGLYVAF